MPTSVLLAVLVAAGLLALAPALVRRYDATERWDAERASSTARVLARRRRRRTVPGRAPVNPPLGTADAADRRTAAADAGDGGPERRDAPARPSPGPPRRPRPEPSRTPRPRVPQPRDPVEQRRWWRRRRRRVFGTLVLVFVVEAVAAVAVGPGFLVGLSLAALLLGWYAGVLRRTVVTDHRRRLREHLIAREREAAAAAEQRRIAEKRRRMAEARRHAQELARQRAEETARQRAEEVTRDEARRADGGAPGVAGLRGQSYQARAANF